MRSHFKSQPVPSKLYGLAVWKSEGVLHTSFLYLTCFFFNFSFLPSAVFSGLNTIPSSKRPTLPAQVSPTPSSHSPKVNLHNNEPCKGRMTSSLSGSKLLYTASTFLCSDYRAGMWWLIHCGVRSWAGPAAVEQTSVSVYTKNKQANKQKKNNQKNKQKKNYVLSSKKVRKSHSAVTEAMLPLQSTHFSFAVNPFSSELLQSLWEAGLGPL